MLNCAKEYMSLLLGVVVLCFISLLVIPILCVIVLWHVLLSIVYWDIGYIDEELRK